jgi:hypothetical protein
MISTFTGRDVLERLGSGESEPRVGRKMRGFLDRKIEDRKMRRSAVEDGEHHERGAEIDHEKPDAFLANLFAWLETPSARFHAPYVPG